MHVLAILGEISLCALGTAEGTTEKTKVLYFNLAVPRIRELLGLKNYKKIAWNHLAQCPVQYLKYIGLAIELPD